MANENEKNIHGSLYFYGKKGVREPFSLSYGKTTLGSSQNCNIRIKGTGDDILCVLDANEVGVTILVNECEDERILINGKTTKKYSVLRDEDHLIIGNKKFKYSNSATKEEDLKIVEQAIVKKMIGENHSKRLQRNSSSMTPLKRLQKEAPGLKRRRFSEGSRIPDVKNISKVSERNLILSTFSTTPQSASKARFSQRMAITRNSSLRMLKENEVFDSNVNLIANSSRKNITFSNINKSEENSNSSVSKKNKTFSGNLHQLDVNSSKGSYMSPLPSKKKIYSGNLSEASEIITTPENNISAVTITPLNVLKKRGRSLNKSNSISHVDIEVETSTPKSAMKPRRSSAMYRPIVEEITPVLSLPRISSLKKPAFTQRRSVNFNVSSPSDGSSLQDSESVERPDSSKKGTKRKRSISDISGLASKRKIVKNNTLVHSFDNGVVEENSSLLEVTLSDSSLNTSIGEESTAENPDKSTLSKAGKENISGNVTRTSRASKLTVDVGRPSFIENTSTRRISLSKNSNKNDSFSSCDVEVSLSHINISGLADDDSLFKTPSKSVSRVSSRLESSAKRSVCKSNVTDDDIVNSTHANSKRSIRLSAKIESSPKDSVKVSQNRRSYQIARSEDLLSESGKNRPTEMHENEETDNLSFRQSARFSRNSKKYESRPSLVKKRVSKSVDRHSTDSPNKALKETLHNSINLSKAKCSPSKVSRKSENIQSDGDNTSSDSFSLKLTNSDFSLKNEENDQSNLSRRSSLTDFSQQSISNESPLCENNINFPKVSSTPLVDTRYTGRLSRTKTPGSSVQKYSTVSKSRRAMSLGSKTVKSDRVSKNLSVGTVSHSLSQLSSSERSRRSVSSLKGNKLDSISSSKISRTPDMITSSSVAELCTPNRSKKSIIATKNTPNKNISGRFSKTPIVVSSSLIGKSPLGKSKNLSSIERNTSNLADSSHVSNKSGYTISPSSPTELSVANRSRRSQYNNEKEISNNGIRHSRTARSSLDAILTNTPSFDRSTVNISDNEQSTFDLSDTNKVDKSSRKNSTLVSLPHSYSESPSNRSRSMYVDDQKTPNNVTSRRISKTPGVDVENSTKTKTPASRKSQRNVSIAEQSILNSNNISQISKTSESIADSIVQNNSMNSTKTIQVLRTPTITDASLEISSSNRIGESLNVSERSTRSNAKSRSLLGSSVLANVSVNSCVSNISTRSSSLDIGNKTRASSASSELSRISNPISYSFIDSPNDSSIYESLDSSLRRSSRKTRPSIDEHTYELYKPKTSLVRHNDSSNVNMAELGLKSPGFSKADLTDVAVVEAAFDKLLAKSPRKSLKANNSPQKVVSATKTFKVQKSPKNDLTDISIMKSLFKTPRAVKSPKNDLSDISGVKSLLNTPNTFESPRTDLSNVSIVQTLFKSPGDDLTPKYKRAENNLNIVAGVKKLLKTAKAQKSPKNDLTNILGLKKLLQTPKYQNSPKNDLTNIAGVKKLLKTPRAVKSPKNDLTNIVGLKKMMQTPKYQKSPKNDLTNIVGVKKLLKTPRAQKSPKNDLTNIVGLKKLIQTPKYQNSPKNDLTDIVGVKKLLKTPRTLKSPKNDLTNIVGVKNLMRTPKDLKSPKNDLSNVAGVKKLLGTPKEQRDPKNDLSDVRGVRNLLRTPKNKCSDILDTLEISGLDKLFSESNDGRFNSLSGKKPLRTYSKSPKSQHQSRDEIEVPEVQEHVLEWVKEQSKLTSEPQSVKTRAKRNRNLNSPEESLNKKKAKADVEKLGVQTSAKKKHLYDTAAEGDLSFAMSEQPSSTPIIGNKSCTIQQLENSGRVIGKGANQESTVLQTRREELKQTNLSKDKMETDVPEIIGKKTRGRTVKEKAKKDDEFLTKSLTKINEKGEKTPDLLANDLVVPKEKSRGRNSRKQKSETESSMEGGTVIAGKKTRARNPRKQESKTETTVEDGSVVSEKNAKERNTKKKESEAETKVEDVSVIPKAKNQESVAETMVNDDSHISERSSRKRNAKNQDSQTVVENKSVTIKGSAMGRNAKKQKTNSEMKVDDVSVIPARRTRRRNAEKQDTEVIVEDGSATLKGGARGKNAKQQITEMIVEDSSVIPKRGARGKNTIKQEAKAEDDSIVSQERTRGRNKKVQALEEMTVTDDTSNDDRHTNETDATTDSITDIPAVTRRALRGNAKKNEAKETSGNPKSTKKNVTTADSVADQSTIEERRPLQKTEKQKSEKEIVSEVSSGKNESKKGSKQKNYSKAENIKRQDTTNDSLEDDHSISEGRKRRRGAMNRVTEKETVIEDSSKNEEVKLGSRRALRNRNVLKEQVQDDTSTRGKNEEGNIDNGVLEKEKSSSKNGRKGKKEDKNDKEGSDGVLEKENSSSKNGRKGKKEIKNDKEESDSDKPEQPKKTKVRANNSNKRKISNDKENQQDEPLVKEAKIRNENLGDEVSIKSEKQEFKKTRTRSKQADTEEIRDESDSHDQNKTKNTKAKSKGKKTESPSGKGKKMVKSKIDNIEIQSVSPVRKTRANKGLNKKYDDAEWETPIKTPVRKVIDDVRKKVTFENEKIETTGVDHEGGLKRSKRIRK